jgi:hypothetical protein
MKTVHIVKPSIRCFTHYGAGPFLKDRALFDLPVYYRIANHTHGMGITEF